jgi:K+-sensing histidine kinase KdpD
MQNSLQVIEEEADRLTDLIEDLLDASRLQVGAMQLKKTDIALLALVNRLAEKFRVQTDDHQIVVEIPENFPVITADEVRIEQVIANMISNAIKYAPNGEIHITGQARPDQIIVCVKDEGPGIAKCDLPHIFDRFYRAQETSRKTKGAGLGLYLARAIVEAHHGRMWADPTMQKGARICFSLPRDSEDGSSEK